MPKNLRQMKKLFILLLLSIAYYLQAQENSNAIDTLEVKWDKQIMISKSTLTSGDNEPAQSSVESEVIELKPFAVGIITTTY
jgi:hypothetical protein